MYYNKDSQQKDRERDILILMGMQGTIIAYLLVHLCRRMMEKKKMDRKSRWDVQVVFQAFLQTY